MIHIAPCRTRPPFAVDNRAVAVFETLPAGCTAFTVADHDCAPLLRPGDVAVVDPAGTVEDSATVRLPIGMLGHDVELASLVVRAR